MMKTKPSAIAVMLASSLLLSTTAFSSIAGNGNGNGNSGQPYPGANGQPFQALQSQIDNLSADLATAVAFLQGQIDELVSSQADQDVLIEALQTSVGALESRVLENETDISALTIWNNMQDQLIANMSSRIDALEARVSDNENDIAAIILSDQAMQQMIQMIKNNILIIEQRIDVNDSELDYLQSRVVQLNAQITNLYAQLSTKQNRISSACAAGSSIRVIYANGSVSCEIDNVSAGVGRLIRNLQVRSVSMPQSIVTVTRRSVTSTCPSGYQVSGGGHAVSNGGLGAGMVRQSRPSGNSWYVWAEADSTFSSRTLYGYAMCLKVI
jgi:peptidoglycan hydrolase CwlO-like protein